MAYKFNKNKPQATPTSSTLKTIWRLLGFLKPYRYLVLLSLILLILSTVLTLITPVLTKTAIDNYILATKADGLLKLALIIVLVSVVQSVLSSLLRILTEYVSQNTVHYLRKTLYEHISNLSISFFDWAKTGDLLARITSDTQSIGGLYGFALINLFVNTLTFIGIFVVVTIWDYRLGLLYLVLLPFVYLAMKNYAFKVRPLFRRNRQVSGEITSVMQEVITSIPVVKLFGKETHEVERFATKNQEVCDILINTSKVSSFWMPYVGFLTSVAAALVLLIGGSLVIDGKLTVGTLIAYTSYLGLLARPIRQSGFLISRIQSSAASGERIFEILDTVSNVKEKDDAIILQSVQGKITFEDVYFGYGKDPLLKDVNLEISAEEMVAFVGPTGAGKSTLISLIPRFYDPQKGRILLDGVDIREYTLKSLRSKIGFVLQETFLFDGTIRENISYGKPEASLTEVRKAAQAAEIDEFIMSLPLQYETPIGERGIRLSGGQRQRLAIARVLLVDPPILILDEPTANIDAKTEAKMERALLTVTKNRTTLIIAHRLWAIKNANRIFVIEEGKITASGSHEELITKEGFYQTAYRTQALGLEGSQ